MAAIHTGQHDPAVRTGNKTTDNAIVNVPLSKRGDLNAQIDKWKREQVAIAKAKTTETTNERKLAKSLLAQHGPKLKEKFGAKFGPEFDKKLKSMAQWEPTKFINMVKGFEK